MYCIASITSIRFEISLIFFFYFTRTSKLAHLGNFFMAHAHIIFDANNILYAIPSGNILFNIIETVKPNALHVDSKFKLAAYQWSYQMKCPNSGTHTLHIQREFDIVVSALYHQIYARNVSRLQILHSILCIHVA